jgi:hypothetical protein
MYSANVTCVTCAMFFNSHFPSSPDHKRVYTQHVIYPRPSHPNRPTPTLTTDPSDKTISQHIVLHNPNRPPMQGNSQHNKRMPNRMRSSPEPVQDPTQPRREESLGDVRGVEGEADEVGCDRGDDGTCERACESGRGGGRERRRAYG